MNLVNEYINSNDKISFFSNLSVEDKKKLFREMTYTEQKELLMILPFNYIKQFINSFNQEERKNLYSRLSENQLKAIYNTLSEEDKQKMASSLEERQADFIEKVNRHTENIQKKTTDIALSQHKIQESTINITNAKEAIHNNKNELKQVKVQLKKLEKERDRNLKKLLKASRSSPFDRIGIISKYRTNKLLKRQAEIEQTKIDINNLKGYRENIQQNIQTAQNRIVNEQQKIVDMKERIQRDKQSIHSNTKAIRNTEIKIKKLSQAEKRLLGRKLYHQQISERDAIIIRRKKQETRQQEIRENNTITPPNKKTLTENNQAVVQQSGTDKVIQSEVVDTPKDNKQQQIQQFLDQMIGLNNMGVNFYPPMNILPKMQGQELIEDPITTMTRNQLIMATYSMIAIYNYQRLLEEQKQNQVNQSQDLAQGYTKILHKGNPGLVSLTFLISILLLLLTTMLFFMR